MVLGWYASWMRFVVGLCFGVFMSVVWCLVWSAYLAMGVFRT